MCVFRLHAPLARGSGEEVVGCMKCTLKGEKGRGVWKVLGRRPGRFRGRRRKGWRRVCAKEEGVGKVAKPAKVIESKGKEGDIIGVEISNKERGINLGRASNKLLADAQFVCNMKGVGRWELRR